jgi:prepilin-type processing-associated H-X9-DG protein
LLTVIAIIGILAAIIIPTVGKVRTTAKTAQGLSNLRQITLATLAYAGDNKNRFPVISGNRYFYTELSSYLSGRGNGNNQDGSFSKVFVDPLAAINGGDNHYTGNNNMVGYTTARPITAFRSPSTAVLYFDGAQVYAPGNAEPGGWAVDNGGLNGDAVAARYQTQAWLDTVVAPGPNDDTNATTGNIRWRHQDGQAAKFAFLDGHVAVLKRSEVTRRLFVLD